MTFSLTNNRVNWPEAKQLQWEINCKCYPDSVQPEQEHLRVFSGALGDSAVRKRQEDNARHYTLTADKARFRTLNWKQDRCHSFPEQIQEMAASGRRSGWRHFRVCRGLLDLPLP